MSVSLADDAMGRVTHERLAEILVGLIDIPSPTGQEESLAAHLVDQLRSAGLTASIQTVAGSQASASGTLLGDGNGESLLLYSPIDTVTVGSVDEDLPWAGPELRADMIPRARYDDGVVYGLGAQNPKGHAACVLMAAEAIAAADGRLTGDLHIGFGAGGMPTNGRGLLPAGHGVGCAALVDVLRPDHAVIAKTGWSVSWEEVGLAWFRVDVYGTHTYVGSRHLLPYRNAIKDMGVVVEALESSFEQWAIEHRSGLVAPQGVVGAIDGGWSRMPAFTTAVCRCWLDLRLSPRTTAAEAERTVRAVVQHACNKHGITATVEPLFAIVGTTTDPDARVVRSAVAAWEQVAGRPHRPVTGLSGATDANILRAHGVPTARLGLPKIDEARLSPTAPRLDFQLGMNAVDVADMVRLTHALIGVALDICGGKR